MNLFTCVAFDAEEAAHGLDVGAFVGPSRTTRTAKREDGVEGFFPIGPVLEVLFDDGLQHELADELHPTVVGHPVAKHDPRRCELHKQRKQAMQRGGPFHIRHPPPPVLRLAQRRCELVPVFGKGAIRERELAKGVEGLLQGGGMCGVLLPIGAAFPVLRTELVQRLFASPRFVVVQTVAEEQRKLQQPRAKSGLCVETAPVVSVFEEGPPFYKRN